MTDRYTDMFKKLKKRNQGAFIPFCVVGDPDPGTSLEIMTTLVRAGADALELGIPFSDPIADGPTIQSADMRALKSGTGSSEVWKTLGALRKQFPELPVGLLVYANLVYTPSMDTFYQSAKDSGVDSVLVADVPTIEAEPFVTCAERHDIKPVLIATPGCSNRDLDTIARLSKGYTYVVTRSGVTGAESQAQTNHGDLIKKIHNLGAPPCVLGFGISKPDHVRDALASGAAGAISGSAVVNIVEQGLDDIPDMKARLETFVAGMKKATEGITRD